MVKFGTYNFQRTAYRKPKKKLNPHIVKNTYKNNYPWQQTLKISQIYY